MWHRDHGVTSLANLGLPVTLYDVDVALRKSFQQISDRQDRSTPAKIEAEH